MGIQERKLREREAFRKLIIATAHDLLAKEGLQGLTMRAIANTIEYSQSKIYEFFKSKDQLCEVLFEELCDLFLAMLIKIPRDLTPEEYLSQVILTSIEFHANHPHSDELFTLVCFGPERFKIPHAYLELEKYSAGAVRNLKSPYIQSEEEVLLALDTIRCFKIGLSSLMASDTSIAGKKRVQNIAENFVEVLLRSWKK